MIKELFIYRKKRKLFIRYFSLSAEGKSPKAFIQIMHGSLEHSERYLPLAQNLMENGFEVVLSDLYGHGKSVEKKEYNGNIGKNGIENISQDQQFITHEFNTNHYPVILIGHSMGSLIALHYAHHTSITISKLFLLGTPGDHQFVGKFGEWIAHKLNKKPHHRNHILNLLMFKELSLEFFQAKFSPKLLLPNQTSYEILKATNLFYTDLFFSKINPEIPLYFYSGKQDPINNKTQTIRRLIKKIKQHHPHIHLRFFDHFQHNLVQTKNKNIIIQSILKDLEL